MAVHPGVVDDLDALPRKLLVRVLGDVAVHGAQNVVLRLDQLDVHVVLCVKSLDQLFHVHFVLCVNRLNQLDVPHSRASREECSHLVTACFQHVRRFSTMTVCFQKRCRHCSACYDAAHSLWCPARHVQRRDMQAAAPRVAPQLVASSCGAARRLVRRCRKFHKKPCKP